MQAKWTVQANGWTSLSRVGRRLREPYARRIRDREALWNGDHGTDGADVPGGTDAAAIAVTGSPETRGAAPAAAGSGVDLP